MIILFRSDSSSTIGHGHIRRDLVLAKEYLNNTIHFACQDLEGNLIDEIPYPVHVLKSNDINELIKLIKSLHVDMLVIDHYEFTCKEEKAIKEATGVQILSFDDTYEKHHCDILLNHNISADEKRYKDLVPEHCELRYGSRFTLIRDEFKTEKAKKREKLYDVFVAMGGTDSSNINIPILKSLPHSLHVSVLTTSANTRLKELQAYVKDKENISLHVNSNEVAKLMNESKFAIISPSVIVHEVLFMELPFLAIKTADNQDDIYQYLKEHEFNVLKTWDSQKCNQWLKEKIL